jgi:hypothetical protein
MGFRSYLHLISSVFVVVTILNISLSANATTMIQDESMHLLFSTSGNLDYFATGTALATDTGADGRVDALALPASIGVTTSDVPTGATLLNAHLYWGGTQTQPTATPLSGSPDTAVTLTVPGGSPTAITADVCYGSDGGAASYDMFLCRNDITSLIIDAGGTMTGTYTLDGYTGLIDDGTTDNASAALLLTFSDAALPLTTVVAYDGLVTMVNQTQVVTFSGLYAPSSPSGSLTYYTLEGDTGGSGTEEVKVEGISGGASVILSDAINPSTDPMNGTINTASPTQTGVIGIDIDDFDITSALTAGDTALDVTYSAGTDKWWLGVNVGGFTTVPEPSTGLLLALGLTGLAAARRRRSLH